MTRGRFHFKWEFQVEQIQKVEAALARAIQDQDLDREIVRAASDLAKTFRLSL